MRSAMESGGFSSEKIVLPVQEFVMVHKGDGPYLSACSPCLACSPLSHWYLHSLAEGHIIDEVEQKLRFTQLAKFFHGLNRTL